MNLKWAFNIFVSLLFILLLASCGGGSDTPSSEAEPLAKVQIDSSTIEDQPAAETVSSSIAPVEPTAAPLDTLKPDIVDSATTTSPAEEKTSVSDLPEPTPEQSTSTPMPPTSTPVSSGATSEPSTATPEPSTATPMPPTTTPVPPTATPVPPTPVPSTVNLCDNVPDNYKNDCQKNPCDYVPDNLKQEYACEATPQNQTDIGHGGGSGGGTQEGSGGGTQEGSNPCDSVPDSSKDDCQKNPCNYVPEAGKKQCEESTKNDPNFGSSDEDSGNANSSSGCTNPNGCDDPSGYAQSFDPENIPQVAVANFTELDKFSRMSKLRSGVGHDFSAGTPEYDPTHANCKSMKHYFMPMGVPLEMELYNTPHAFEWMSIKMFSPVDGTIRDVSYSENSYGTEARFGIESSEYPGYTFRFFHIALDPNLTTGSSVQAGQQIGTIGEEDTWGEIGVQVGMATGETYLISFLQVASDDVLQEYKSKGVNTAADVIVTREQRDANPLACDDSPAGWFIGSGREGTLMDMDFVVWAFESTDNWLFFDE